MKRTFTFVTVDEKTILFVNSMKFVMLMEISVLTLSFQKYVCDAVRINSVFECVPT